MKISLVVKVVAIALILVMLGFAGAVSWSLEHLNKAFAMVEFFAQQKDRIDQQVNQPVQLYLRNADLTLLQDLDANLRQLRQDIQTNRELSAAAKQALTTMLGDIQQQTLPALATAGKLSDPQLLLINNERQMAGHLHSLRRYLKKAEQSPLSLQRSYFWAIGQAQAELLDLARNRQSFFGRAGRVSADSMQSQWQALGQAIEALEKLPLLGVMKTRDAEDSLFSLGKAEPKTGEEDMAVEPLVELRSLMSRYQKDLANAKQLLQRKAQTLQDANRQMQAFQTKLQSLEQDIHLQYQQYQDLLYAMMLICGLLVIGMNMAMLWLMRHLAAIVGSISVYIDRLANGDMRNAFVMDSRIAEINQLKGSLEQLHDYFKLLIRNINSETLALQTSGRNIEQVAQNLESIIAEQQQATELAAQQVGALSVSL